MKHTCVDGRYYVATPPTATARFATSFLRLHPAKKPLRYHRHACCASPDRYDLAQQIMLANPSDSVNYLTFPYLHKYLSVYHSILAVALFLVVLLAIHVFIALTQPTHHKDPIVYTNDTVPTQPPPLPLITLLTSAYVGQYSAERQLELALVAARNQRLSSISRYHRLFEPGMNFTPTKHVTGRVLSPGQNVTYQSLFAEAQYFQGVVVLANADIYFDESILCASMLANCTVLALSRHPSPDCFTKSSRGDQRSEPVDFCDGYHPRNQASHDVFIFVPPLPLTFLHALGDLRVNQFGAENVVISLLKAEGFNVVNPCSSIHAFHQHCTGERAPSAKAGSRSVASVRRQYGATFRTGYVHGRQWMDDHFAAKYGAVDCLGFGLMQGEQLRNV